MGEYRPFDLNSEDAGGGSNEPENGAGTAAPFLGGNVGAGDFGGEQFDPDIHSGPDKRNADGSYRKKRGRKPNSAASGGNRKANNQVGIEGLTRVLTIIHVGIASVTKTPEIALDDKEAESLAAATANVLTEFDIRPDPKIEAVIGLVTVAGMIYGPRIYLIKERKKAEREADEKPLSFNSQTGQYQHGG